MKTQATQILSATLIGFSLTVASAAQAACENPALQREFAVPGYLAPPSPIAVENLQFTHADGTTRNLSDYHGKPVMLVFWATWCSGCHAEMPDVDQMISTLADDDIAIIPLSLDTNQAQAKRYLESSGFENIAANLDNDMTIFNDMCFVATPTHAILNRKGELTEVFIGAQPWSDQTAIDYLRKLSDS